MKKTPLKEKLVLLAPGVVKLKRKVLSGLLALVMISFIFTAGVPIAASSLTTLGDTEEWWDPVWDYRGPVTINNMSLVFSDDFNDGDDDGWTILQGDWQVINGEYVYGANGITEIDGVTVVGDINWEDYGFESKFKLIDGQPQIYFLFRFTDYLTYERYDGYSFQYMSDRWGLLKWVTETRIPTIIAMEPSPSSITPGEWYNIKVEVSGDHIKCYVNDELKIEAHDAAHPRGRIGFRADVCKVAFDDVKVFSVPREATSLTLSPSIFNLDSGQSITLTATLTSGGSPLTGKVITLSATSGSLSSLSMTTDSQGQVVTIYTAPTVTTQSLATITASFAGDTQYQPSNGASYGVIGKATVTLMIEPSTFTLEPGGSTTLTAMLISNGAPLAGKTVVWNASVGSVTPLNTVTNSMGQASITYSGPGFETVDTITASFVGDSLYWPSTGTSQATIVYTSPLEAVIDIKPETLRIGSMGEWVTCYIELPGEDVSRIDVSSILLEGIIPVDSTAPTEIGDYDNDGASDLMVKFDRLSVENIVVPGPATLTVTGRVDGSPFAGSDTIDVIQTPPTSRPPGALISVRIEDPDEEPNVRQDIFSFTLDLSTEVNEGLIEVTVGSEVSEGQTIIVNIDNDVIPLEDLDEIEVLFDNQEIEMADDYEDILDPTDEGEAEYVILIGKNGVQLLVSIPHFSVHTITIGKVAAAPPSPQPPAPPAEGIPLAVMLTIVGVALMVAISAAVINLRQARGEATSELIERGLSSMRIQEVDIFREIRDHKEFTIPELIHETGASTTVAWRTVQKLIKKGLVQPTGEVKPPAAGRGKPSTVYKYVGD